MKKLKLPLFKPQERQIGSNQIFRLSATDATFILTFTYDSDAYRIEIPKTSAPVTITRWQNVRERVLDSLGSSICRAIPRSRYIASEKLSELPPEVLQLMVDPSLEPLGISAAMAEMIVPRIPGLEEAVANSVWTNGIDSGTVPAAKTPHVLAV